MHHIVRAMAAGLGLAVVVPSAAEAAITSADLQFWVGPNAGPGVNEAVLVIDWHDGGPGLAWGYRWPAVQTKTGRDLLAAVVGADTRLSADGLASGFISNVGFDANRDGSPERFRPGFDGATGEYWAYYVNNDVYYDPVDFTKNSHIVPPSDHVVPLGNPYDGAGPGAWVSSSTGILDRPLVDGSWDGYIYDVFTSPGPGEPLPATPVPEPGTTVALVASLGIWMRRRRMSQ